MPTMIAAQMYTVRDFTKTISDIVESVKKVKAIGYDAMQVSGFGPIDPAELKKIADDNNIEICATHTGFDRMRDDTQAVIDEHLLWNCKYPAIGSLPRVLSGRRRSRIYPLCQRRLRSRPQTRRRGPDLCISQPQL